MKIFEYVVFYSPKDKPEEAKILCPRTEILALTEDAVKITAARKIPEEYLNRLNEVSIAVRPF